MERDIAAVTSSGTRAKGSSNAQAMGSETKAMRPGM
jgi:hypothetical protein